MKHLITLLAFGLAAPVLADTIIVDGQPQLRQTALHIPQRGVPMNAVEADFGVPRQRHAAVGKPPITRWDYDGFSVYFEYNHVIHAVATR
jgi:hypothetical protein